MTVIVKSNKNYNDKSTCNKYIYHSRTDRDQIVCLVPKKYTVLEVLTCSVTDNDACDANSSKTTKTALELQ